MKLLIEIDLDVKSPYIKETKREATLSIVRHRTISKEEKEFIVTELADAVNSLVVV